MLARALTNCYDNLLKAGMSNLPHSEMNENVYRLSNLFSHDKIAPTNGGIKNNQLLIVFPNIKQQRETIFAITPQPFYMNVPKKMFCFFKNIDLQI